MANRSTTPSRQNARKHARTSSSAYLMPTIVRKSPCAKSPIKPMIRPQFTLRTPSSPTLSAINKPQADAWGLENSGRLLLGKAAGLVLRSAQQGQDALGQLVGLGHHRRAGLLQDLRAAQVGGFRREVGIHDAATGRSGVLGSHLQVRDHGLDRKSTRLNSSHLVISYAVFCLKKKK